MYYYYYYYLLLSRTEILYMFYIVQFCLHDTAVYICVLQYYTGITMETPHVSLCNWLHKTTTTITGVLSLIILSLVILNHTLGSFDK